MGSLQGEGENDEHPQHKVYLDAYYIGKNVVTNAQFAKFVKQTGYRTQGEWEKHFSFNTANHPVVNVSWNDAKAYCDWAGLRLPTEAEWEKAARGTDARRYPWGNEWDASKCNNWNGIKTASMANIYQGRGTIPIASHPEAASPYGVLGQAGNSWEWCADWYDENYYQNSPASNPTGPTKGIYRVLRGGSWCRYSPDLFRCAVRLKDVPENDGVEGGFRCACSK
jgi:formylglycine-generating enzyme required for sulfatase activity